MRPPNIPSDELQRLRALRALCILDTEPEERFDRITRIARATFGVPIALVSLVDSHRQWFKSRQGLSATETSRDISFCGHAVAANAMLVVENAGLDPRFSDNPLVVEDPRIRFYAGQVIHAAGGLPIGTLCVIDRVPRQFEDEQRRMLNDLAALVEQEVAAIELAQEWHGLRERAGFFEDFIDTSPDLAQSVAPDGRLIYVNKAWRESMGYVGTAVPESAFEVVAPSQRDHCRDVFASIMGAGEAVHVETVFVTREGVEFPVNGTISRCSRDGLAHTNGMFRDATIETRLRDALKKEATLDPLTGMPNRRVIMQRLPEAVALATRHGRALSLAMVDLDGFKAINDGHGHSAGDRVLLRLARILSRGLRSTDFHARYGGEEFCIIFPETSAHGAKKALDNVREAFAAAGNADPSAPPATFSAGIAELSPRSMDAETLIRNADQALYLAKREGRNRVCVAVS